MTQEEKANAYDEALERARNLHKDATDMEEGILAKQCEIIFPELLESEDERIRNTLIRFHKSTIDIDGIKGDEIVSWLEKQGTSYTKRDVDGAYVEGMAFAKNELEKQGKQILANSAKTCKDEQKPAWDERDESHLIHCVRLINNAEGCSISEQENAITWLESIKQRMKGE